MRLIVRKFAWALALALVLGGVAGLIDGLTVFFQQSDFVRSFPALLFFRNVLGYYSLFWLALLLPYSLIIILLSQSNKFRSSVFSELTAHLLSAGLCLQWYISTMVWVNRHSFSFFPFQKSMLGNFFYLLLILVCGVFLFFLLRALQRRLQAKSLSKILRNIVAGVAIFFLLNLGWLAIGSGKKLAGPSKDSKAIRSRSYPNLILITIDALRPDHLSCYGYTKIQTKGIDQLCQEGLIFKNALSNAPWTYPSFISLFTSQYPEAITFCRPVPIPRRIPTLAQTLSQNGFNTGAVITNPYLEPPLGITRGFSYLHHSYHPRPLADFPLTHLNLLLGRIITRIFLKENAQVLTDHSIKWLRQNQAQPFFLWIHYIEPHFPYGDRWISAPNPDPDYQGPLPSPIDDPALKEPDLKSRMNLSPQDIRHLQAYYDYDLSYVDQEVGRLFEFLKKNGLWEKSIIILSADHGEEFFEHGNIDHGKALYWESLNVPLIIKLAFQKSSRVVNAPVELLDLYPTILDLLGIEKPAGLQGQSFISLLQGSEGPVKSYFYADCVPHGPPQSAVRDARFSLIYFPQLKQFRFYDREQDPGEQKDLSEQNLPEMRILQTELKRIKMVNQQLFWELHPIPGKLKEVELNRERLKALGYIK